MAGDRLCLDKSSSPASYILILISSDCSICPSHLIGRPSATSFRLFLFLRILCCFVGTMDPLPFCTQYSVCKTHQCCCICTSGLCPPPLCRSLCCESKTVAITDNCSGHPCRTSSYLPQRRVRMSPFYAQPFSIHIHICVYVWTHTFDR